MISVSHEVSAWTRNAECRGKLVTIILAISLENEAMPKGGACAISFELYAAVN